MAHAPRARGGDDRRHDGHAALPFMSWASRVERQAGALQADPHSAERPTEVERAGVEVARGSIDLQGLQRRPALDRRR